MSGRDPRLDPRAGDVLRKGRRQRMVKRLGLGPIRPSCLTAPRPLTGVGLRIATLERELATVVRQAVEASGYRYADGEGPEIVAWHRVLDHLEAMRPKAEAAELLIRRHGPRTRHAAIRKGEHRPWLPATYEDLLDFIVGKPATAEEPSEAAEPAPATAQRYRCKGCGAGLDHPGYRLGVGVVRGRLVHTDDGCGPVVTMVEPAPAPARWRCEGCGEEGEAADLATSNGHVAIVPDANGDPEPHLCGPCVPVTDAQPAGAAP